MKRKTSLYIGIICAAVMGLVYLAGLFELAEYQALDFLFAARGAKPIDPNIVIIEIDDKSLEELGRWPWTRNYHAALLDILEKNKPKIIAFDILFCEPQYEHPEEDKLLAHKTKQLNNVFYAAFVTLKEDNLFFRRLRKPTSVTLPLPELLESSHNKQAGFVNIMVEPDGKVRKAPLSIDYNGQTYLSLDFLCVSHFLDKSPDELKIPTDKEGMMWINYSGDFQRFKRISFYDIACSYDQLKKDEKPKIDLSELKDKIILIGLSATGTEDYWATSVGALYPGIGIRANAINTMLQKDFIHRTSPFSNFIIILIVGVALGLVVPKRKPLGGAIFFLALAGGFILVAIIAFAFFNIWIALATPLIMLSISYLAITLNQVVVARFEKELIDKELQIASRIQKSILPQALPQVPQMEIGVKCVPAKHVGGDFYDFINFSYDAATSKEERTGIIIGDVSGKGVPAALFMAKAMADFRGISHNYQEPDKALSAINDLLTREGVAGMFVTLQYLIYEPAGRVIKYANGGHNPLIRIQKNGQAQSLTQEVGAPIGIIPGSEFMTDDIKISEGEVFVLYTDGISEARDKNGKEFGESRILESAKNNKDLPAQEFAERLVDEVASFSKGMPQHDDMTVIVLKIKE